MGAVREDPSPSPGPGPQTGPFIELLKVAAGDPGNWYRIRDYPDSLGAARAASALRKKRLAARRPPGEWEFKTGKLEGRAYAVYARLIQPNPNGGSLATGPDGGDRPTG